MKVVFTSVFQSEAIVVKSLLESAGIEAEMLVDGMLEMNPLFSMEMKGVQVVVPDVSAEDALAVVSDFRAHKKE